MYLVDTSLCLLWKNIYADPPSPFFKLDFFLQVGATEPCVLSVYFGCVLSCIRIFAAPWTVAHQVPLSMEFSKQESWSGLPFPTPRDLLNSGIKPATLTSPALAGGFFTTGTTWEAPCFGYQCLIRNMICNHFLPLRSWPFHFIVFFSCTEFLV